MFRKSTKSPFTDDSKSENPMGFLNTPPTAESSKISLNDLPPRIFEEEQKESPPVPRPHNPWVEDERDNLNEDENFVSEPPETTIGEGVGINGELHFKRFLCIHGSFEGNLVSNGKIFVGPSGKVVADIQMQEAIIEGAVQGNITTERLELRGEAQVHGDIIAKSLSVDEGVTIMGQVMVSPQETACEEEKSDKESPSS